MHGTIEKQKFHKGDYVQVAKDLGSCMSHFQADCEAIVIGSYAEQHGGSNTSSYTIHIKDRGQVSWYEEDQLTMIAPSRLDLLEQWEAEKAAEIKEKSDLDWIFANGREVLTNPHGSSVGALAGCFGLTNLWGTSGEYFVYYENMMRTLQMAYPFLFAGGKEAKDGWLAFCDKIKPANQK
jgi:hypothetical protein